MVRLSGILFGHTGYTFLLSGKSPLLPGKEPLCQGPVIEKAGDPDQPFVSVSLECSDGDFMDIIIHTLFRDPSPGGRTFCRDSMITPYFIAHLS